MIRLAVLAILGAVPCAADTIVAARTIRAQEIIGPTDLVVRNVDMVGGISDPNAVVGMEARVALYAGRPIRLGDIGTPSVVDRNQIIPLIYSSSGLVISTEGRALDRAGPGDTIRVMNLASRSTVSATIDASGAAYVQR